jgi:hypothetical protein
MARKPSAILQYKLRIREPLRRRIEKAATKNGVSANAEMNSRLERSFNQESVRSIDVVATHLSNTVDRIDTVAHGLNKQGDLLRVTEALLQALDAGNGKSIAEAAEKAKQVVGMINIEAARVLRKMHTT